MFAFFLLVSKQGDVVTRDQRDMLITLNNTAMLTIEWEKMLSFRVF